MKVAPIITSPNLLLPPLAMQDLNTLQPALSLEDASQEVLALLSRANSSEPTRAAALAGAAAAAVAAGDRAVAAGDKAGAATGALPARLTLFGRDLTNGGTGEAPQPASFLGRSASCNAAIQRGSSSNMGRSFVFGASEASNSHMGRDTMGAEASRDGVTAQGASKAGTAGPGGAPRPASFAGLKSLINGGGSKQQGGASLFSLLGGSGQGGGSGGKAGAGTGSMDVSNALARFNAQQRR